MGQGRGVKGGVAPQTLTTAAGDGGGWAPQWLSLMWAWAPVRVLPWVWAWAWAWAPCPVDEVVLLPAVPPPWLLVVLGWWRRRRTVVVTCRGSWGVWQWMQLTCSLCTHPHVLYPLSTRTAPSGAFQIDPVGVTIVPLRQGVEGTARGTHVGAFA